MTKMSHNLAEEIRRQSESPNSLNNLSKLKNWIDPKSFHEFIESFGDENSENETTLSEFFTSQNKKIVELWDMSINLCEIQSEKQLPKNLQIIISKIFIKKLHSICQSTDQIEEFDTTFGDDYETLEIDLKTLNTKLINFDESTINSITISNNDIFDKLNILPLATFSEQDPSNQSNICKLINREIKDVIQNLENLEIQTKQEMSDIITPSTNLTKNLEIDQDTQTKIIDLKVQKYWLEENWKNDELKKINEEIWALYLKWLEQNDENKKIVEILRKLIQNGFNFQALNNKEKTILAQKSISKNIWENNNFANRIWIDTNDYQKFLMNLYDFSKNSDTLKIKVWDQTIKLNITKKFAEWEHKQFYNFENFENIGSLPISFEINLDGNTQDIINLLEDPQNAILSQNININWVIWTYPTKNWDIRLWNKYQVNIGWKEINTDTINSNFDETTLKDSDIKITSRKLTLDWNNTNKISQLYLLSKTWQQEEILINNENNQEKRNKLLDQKPELWNFDRINDGWTEWKEKWEEYAQEIFDDLEDIIPDEDDDDADNDHTDTPERLTLVNKWNNYFSQLNDEWKKAFKDKLRDLGEKNDLEDDVEKLLEEIDDSTVKEEEKTEEEAETPQESRERQREKVKWDKECKFENWTRLYFKNLLPIDTELPPDDINDYYFVFEICNVQWAPWEWTFGLKLIWDEFNSKESGWKIYNNLPITWEQLKQMLNTPIYKMPERKRANWDDCLMRVNKSGIISKMSTFGNREWQTTFDWKKFIDKDWNEIKYFNRVEDIYDIDAKKQWKKISKYEIKWIDRSKWTVKIASTFDWYKEDKDWQNKQVKYKYENEMTFEQFIIFIESKKLKWYNAEQQKEIETQYGMKKESELPNRWLFRMASIWNLMDIFKWSFKAIKDKMKENKEEQKEALENFMYSNEWLGLYRHLWNIFSLWGLLDGVQDSFYEMELDYYNNRDSKIWKKIDKWYSKFSSDPVFAKEFMAYLVPILSRWWYIWDRKDRYKFAAAFLFMVKKEWPYTRVFKDKLWEWYWVEAFLWPNHKKRFQNFYKKKEQEINEAKDMGYPSWVRLNMMSDLNKMEVQYIICVIDWAAPYNSDDEDVQKSIRWSKKFKDELQSNLDWYYGSIDSEKQWIKTFYQWEEQYLRTVWAWRFNKALPSLAAMCEKASTPGEIFRLKWYIISAMLMWVLKNWAWDASTYKTFWQTARAMWFGPLFWARDPDHPEKVLNLLDWISKWDPKIASVSKTLNFNLDDFTPPHIKWDYKDFTKNFRQKYWNPNWKNILKYIENPIYGWENSLKARADAKQDENRQLFADIVKFNNDDDAWDLNRTVNSINYIKEAPLTATWNIMKWYMPYKWEYKTEKEEDRKDAKDAWTKIWKEIAEADPNNIEYYFKYFVNIFGNNINNEQLIRTIPLIQRLKANGHIQEAQYIWWHIFQWSMHIYLSWWFPEEFETCFNNFSNLFFNNIEKINKPTIKRVFTSELANYYDKPYRMVNRKERSEKMWWDDSIDTKWWAFKNIIKNKKYGDYDTINYIIKQNIKRLRNQWTSFERLSPSLKNSTLNIECTYTNDKPAKINGNNDALDEWKK